MASRTILSKASTSAIQLVKRNHPISSSSSSSSSAASAIRSFQSSSVQDAISKFAMPAMSPTMTQGGVASWKVKQGQSFSQGDVLLEIETDKATMDVEAQDDGVMGLIIIQDGAKDVQVGTTLALIAEQGDDISNLEPPVEEQTSSSTTTTTTQATPASAPQPTSTPPTPSPSSEANHGSSHHPNSGPVFPSVSRLIAEHKIQDAHSKIRGTGVRGMITKGDVLAFLGIAKTPTGSYKAPKSGIAVLGPSPAELAKIAASSASSSTSSASQPLTAEVLRSLILGGLSASSKVNRSKAKLATETSLDGGKDGLEEILQGYQFSNASKKVQPIVHQNRKDGIRKDDPLWDLI
ncbi:single hybrid motif-containing protein [Violaceomyces palustris]|uniref:Single hybrid motif-containing protein n=1 Tax=Violaceomyces palustris TaxID=1673888 RepID=A0ACD0NXC4_9BASI|nr:single hybrid motif-containing protein [Violaceomyces palustris]